jgi:MOSC domain-containing protein YiiM
MTRPVLRSIQVGLPRELGTPGATDPMDRPWATSFGKFPVAGPVRVGEANLEGDAQADLVHHGGPEKAILASSADHYDRWRQELNMADIPFGAFGENFSIGGLTEANVCLGDIWQVGDAVLQISQPRQPCWKMARWWRRKSFALEVQQSGRTGWYFRVLQPGVVAAGMPLWLTERAYPDWTVERANQVMHVDKSNLRLAAELAAIPVLSSNWRATMTKRMERQDRSDSANRLIGPNESRP